LASKNVRSDVVFKIIKIGLIGSYLLFFPFFIDSLSKSVNEAQEILEEVIIFWNHAPLEISLMIRILNPHVDGCGLFILLAILLVSLGMIVRVLVFHH